jgi:hypothetical protein
MNIGGRGRNAALFAFQSGQNLTEKIREGEIIFVTFL